MRIIAPMMILIMMTSTLAGCTGGDPDSGGEMDSDAINDLIDQNLQDFINNTTITVNQEIHHHYYNNTTVNEGDMTNNDYATEYNNTTVIDGGEVTNYDQSTTYYNGSSMGSNHSNYLMMMVDMTFTIDDLLPEGIEQIDYRNNTFNYMWTYYDYLTNEDRTDIFVFSCQVYYIVGSQSQNNQTTYWNSSSYTYHNAWDNMYNNTISNLLENAAYSSSYDGLNIREVCDENYMQDTLSYQDLVITEIEIPEGFALQCVTSYTGYYGIEYLYKQRLDGTWDSLWSYNEGAQKWIYGDYYYCNQGLVGGLEDTTMEIRGHHDMDMTFDGNFRYVFYYQLVPVAHIT